MFRVYGEDGRASVFMLKPSVGDVADVSSCDIYFNMVVLPALSRPLVHNSQVLYK